MSICSQGWKKASLDAEHMVYIYLSIFVFIFKNKKKRETSTTVSQSTNIQYTLRKYFMPSGWHVTHITCKLLILTVYL